MSSLTLDSDINHNLWQPEIDFLSTSVEEWESEKLTERGDLPEGHRKAFQFVKKAT